MTDWLNVEEVRAEVTAQRLPDGHINEQWYMGRMVLEAIAELPEPDAGCAATSKASDSLVPCGLLKEEHATRSFVELYVEPDLHRLWRIARVICGNDLEAGG